MADDRPYAGQSDDINDKLLLDLAWERQQKKVWAADLRIRRFFCSTSRFTCLCDIMVCSG